jgi:hypothetical protein
MSLLIHATITIQGDAAQLGACEARMRHLLSSQFLKDEVTEHHSGKALCYDLKVEGGVPFPAFAQASQEFPNLSFAAEWVDVAAGERGSAKLVDGRLTEQSTERIATGAGDEHPVCVAVAADGGLTLALALFRAGRDEWRGYALTAARDALLRVQRRPDSSVVEIFATDGAAEWSLHWRGDVQAGKYHLRQVAPPIPIEDTMYRELDQLARSFVAEWIWFAAGPREEIAIEQERYSRRGYATGSANVRTVKLHRLLADTGEGRALEHSTLGGEERWIKDVILATWGQEPVIRD